MFTDKNIAVKIPNTDFILESNKTYTVIGRVDESSPIEFREQGISKIPHPLNTFNATVNFDSTLNVWDTGTFESSPCYRGVSSKQVKETVKILKEELLPELFLLEPEENYDYKAVNKAFDEYGFSLIENLKISTSIAKNFWGLWIALISGTIAPEKAQKNPKYRELRTPYVLIDRKEVATSGQKNKATQSDAIFNFMSLLKDNKKQKRELLFDILAYTGLKVSTKTEDTILNTQFLNWIESKSNGAKNAENFVKNAKYFSTTAGEDELETYKLLVEAKKENLVIEKRGDNFIGKNNIGPNLKEAAKKVLEKAPLLKELQSLLNSK